MVHSAFAPRLVLEFTGRWVSVHPSDLAPDWIVLSLRARGSIWLPFPSSLYGSTPLFRTISVFRSSFSDIVLYSLNRGLSRRAICRQLEVMFCLHVLDTRFDRPHILLNGMVEPS